MSKYVSTFDQINNSKRNSIIVVIVYIILFALLFALIGFLFSGANNGANMYDIVLAVSAGGAIGILISLIVSFYTYRNSGKILAKAANAVELSKEENPYIYETINAVATGAEMQPPKAYIIETGELNAFASGSNKGQSMVAVTRGLIDTLNREELEGVIAHEIAHLKNDDIKFVSLVAALSATLLLIIGMLSRGFLFSGAGRSRGGRRGGGGGGNAVITLVIIVLAVLAMILAPLVVRAMQSAVSKQREFLADSSGTAIIGYPLGLASALEKIDEKNRSYLSNHESAFKNSSIHALCISEPMAKKVSRIFSTHPSIEERVKRLRGEK